MKFIHLLNLLYLLLHILVVLNVRKVNDGKNRNRSNHCEPTGLLHANVEENGRRYEREIGQGSPQLIIQPMLLNGYFVSQTKNDREQRTIDEKMNRRGYKQRSN